MADADLTQELGFDASSAIASLEQLDSVLAKANQSWNSFANTLKSFNDAGSTTSNRLSQITRQANAAAAALGRLNSGTPHVGGGGAGGNQLLTGQAAANAMNALLGQTNSNANAAANALGQVGNAANRNMNAAAVATGKFAVSFETLTRVILTQAIVRALSAFRNAVEQSFTANLAFVKSLSEIQTIDSGSSIEKLSAEVRSLSDSFNIPLLDAAKAKYEILSNGFTTASDQTNLFTASAKFSKTAIAEMSTSVDLLSGTLNAYGLSSEHAESVAAKFFKTVDLGKTIGSELATSFGRVAPVAAELGVSLSEVDAAFSTITIAGVKTSEAATQIRASLTALLKPSDATKEALHELGYESGQQLIAAKGLQGAFQALIGTTNGQAAAIAKLFPNVRALNAVLRLTGTGVDTFQDHLKQISTISNESFNKTYQLRIDTNAEKVASDLNKLSNFFTVELGESLVTATRNSFEFVGGVEAVTDGMKAMVPILITAAGVLAAYGASAAYASLQSRLAAASATGLGQALSGVFAIAAAFSIGEFLGERLADELNNARKNFEKTMDAWVASRRASAEQEVQIEALKNQKIVQAFNSYIGDVRKEYFKQVDAAKEANSEILSNTRSTLDRIIQARQEHARDLERLAGEGQSRISESRQRQQTAATEAADSAFNFRNRRFSPNAQIFQLQRRAQDIAAQAAAQLGSAKTPDQLQGALSQFSRASGFAQQAESIAQSNGSLSQQAQVQRTILSILDKKVQAEQQYQKLQEQNVKQAQAAAAEENKRVQRLKELAQTILKGSDLFDKKGSPLSAAERGKNLGNAKDALDEFFKLSTSRNKFDAGDLFTFDSLKRRLESSVSQTEIDQLKLLPETLQRLNHDISKGVGVIEVAVKLVAQSGIDTSKLKGKDALETLQGLSDLVGEHAKGIESQANLDVLRRFHLDTANTAAAAAHTAFKAQTENQPILNAERIAAIGGRRLIDPKGVQAEVQEFANLKKEILDFADGAILSAKQVADLTARVDTFLKNAPAWAKITGDVVALSGAFESAGKAAENRKLARANPQSTKTGKGVLQSDRNTFADLAERLGKLGQSAAIVTENAEITSRQYQTQLELSTQLAAQMERQAAAAERISAARGAGETAGIVGESFGGMPGARHYAHGGFVKKLKYFDQGGWAPRGTDTIPAMLSPGEFVMNASATQRYFSQLQAMNAGATSSAPTPSVVNNHYTVGDVVIQGKAAPMGPRDVARAIQRELRRGTIPNKFT